MKASPIDRSFAGQAATPRLVAVTPPPGTANEPAAGPGAIVVRTSRWKTALFILAAAALAAMALLEMRDRLDRASGLDLIVVMAQPLMMLAGALVLAGLVVRRPELTLTTDGVALRGGWRSGRWAWSEVERIEMRLSRRGFLQVVLLLQDDIGGTSRRRLPGMWSISPHQLAAMLEAARRSAAKGRQGEVVAAAEAARMAHDDGGLPASLQQFADAVRRIF